MRAWIETIPEIIYGLKKIVARRVRAWIETFNLSDNILGIRVARRVRAWIETSINNC